MRFKTIIIFLLCLSFVTGCSAPASSSPESLSVVAEAPQQLPETTEMESAETEDPAVSVAEPDSIIESSDIVHAEDEPVEEAPVYSIADYADYVGSVVSDIAESYGAVGAQVAVIENGTVAGCYTYGWATSGEDPMTWDHKFRVASISKVMIGIAAMILREDGIVDLDEDISTYWGTYIRNPSCPDIPITLRSMLTHTSSISPDGENYSADYHSILSRLQNGGFYGVTPGDIGGYCYNNYAYRVLGMTLELASGKKLDDILGERLYWPLYADVAFASGDIYGTDKLVTLYQGGEIGRSTSTQRNSHTGSSAGSDASSFAGGFTASAYDLAKIVSVLASGGEYEGTRILQEETVTEMENYITTPLSDGTHQALSLFYVPDIYEREGIYFHSGSAYGAYNCISYDPITGDGVVVLTSGASGAADRYDIYNVCDEINYFMYWMMDQCRNGE